MKLLLISSSPRRDASLTFLLAQELLKGCDGQDLKSEVIHLVDVRIEFCRNCEICHKNINACSIKDDAPALLKKMLEADGIILASPNYVNQVTASMKALFDRSSHFIHCKRLLGKYFVAAVTSGSGQDEAVVDYIKHYALICGAQFSGGVSTRVPISKEKMEEAFALGQKLACDIKEKREYPEQLEAIRKFKEHFKKIMHMRSCDWEEEYDYWKEKGWL
ncbi:MAG: flavodoxin family protein [Candidatus Omnitrophota bacterium]